MPAKVLDPSAVNIIVNGVPVDGYADGTFVNVVFNADMFALVKGADGEGARVKSNDRSAQVTISLLQTSATNDLLSALHLLDINSPNGDGVGPLLIEDKNGTSLFAAEHCWIRKYPDAAWSKGGESRDWVIETDELNALVGGNNFLAE